MVVSLDHFFGFALIVAHIKADERSNHFKIVKNAIITSLDWLHLQFDAGYGAQIT